MQVENETNDVLSNERAGNLENNIFSWSNGCQHIREKKTQKWLKSISVRVRQLSAKLFGGRIRGPSSHHGAFPDNTACHK